MPESSALRIVFAGTPEFARAHLETLIHSQHALVAVYTQPDRPSGRGRKLQPSPVKALALAHQLPVRQPESLRDAEAQAALADWQADVLVVVAYGLILPAAVLRIPRLGCINVHASLLPRWRGAAPIQRAIEAGDSETGVCIMQMERGLDTGPVLSTARLCIEESDTGGSLHDKLMHLGPPLLLDTLNHLSAALARAEIQSSEGVTYAHKLEKAESRLDWQDSATHLARKVRAFNPFPVAWTTLQGQPLRIWAAQAQADAALDASPGTIVAADKHGILVRCGDGQLLLTTLQLPGGRSQSVRDLLNARADLFAPGTVLGQS